VSVQNFQSTPGRLFSLEVLRGCSLHIECWQTQPRNQRSLFGGEGTERSVKKEERKRPPEPSSRPKKKRQTLLEIARKIEGNGVSSTLRIVAFESSARVMLRGLPPRGREAPKEKGRGLIHYKRSLSERL